MSCASVSTLAGSPLLRLLDERVKFLQSEHGDGEHHEQKHDVGEKIVAPEQRQIAGEKRQQHGGPERDGTAEASEKRLRLAGRRGGRSARGRFQPVVYHRSIGLCPGDMDLAGRIPILFVLLFRSSDPCKSKTISRFGI